MTDAEIRLSENVKAILADLDDVDYWSYAASVLPILADAMEEMGHPHARIVREVFFKWDYSNGPGSWRVWVGGIDSRRIMWRYAIGGFECCKRFLKLLKMYVEKPEHAVSYMNHSHRRTWLNGLVVGGN